MTHKVIFYRDSRFDEGVLACVHDILLIDRRVLKIRPESDFAYKGGSYKWAVYNCSDTKSFGEWRGFKTRKAAIEYWVRLVLRSPVTTGPRLIDNSVARPALLKERELLTPPGGE